MLTNKTILITGGGSGIGKALATHLAIDNKVIICGRTEHKLKKVVSGNKNISYYVTDISVPAAIDNLFNQMANDEVIANVLFNNAGVVEHFNIMEGEYSSAQIFEKINTNLSGAIALTHQFIKQANQLANNLIVNVTSSTAVFPFPLLALYSTSKAGFHTFTKILRHQLKDTTFRVVEVLPSQVETEMPKQIGSTDEGTNVDDFAKGVIKSIKRGHDEYAPGFNVPALKLISKFLPNVGLKLMDNVSKKIFQQQ